MEFGKNFQLFFQEQIGYAFLALLGIVALYYFIKRETGKFFGFVIFALVVAVFVFFPEGIKDFAVELFTKLFGI